MKTLKVVLLALVVIAGFTACKNDRHSPSQSEMLQFTGLDQKLRQARLPRVAYYLKAALYAETMQYLLSDSLARPDEQDDVTIKEFSFGVMLDSAIIEGTVLPDTAGVMVQEKKVLGKGITIPYLCTIYMPDIEGGEMTVYLYGDTTGCAQILKRSNGRFEVLLRTAQELDQQGIQAPEDSELEFEPANKSGIKTQRI